MSKLHATFITMFDEPVKAFLSTSIIKRAIDKKIITAEINKILDFVACDHHKIDDAPYGGGPGELMRVDIIAPMINQALAKNPACERSKKRVILLDPGAPVFDQACAKRLTSYQELVFVCGRYEGIDARVNYFCDEAISLGDFVLSAGDLAACAIFDATARLIPGVLGNFSSSQLDSHQDGLLEASQYTRPVKYQDYEVPAVYKSGDHKKIYLARMRESLRKTYIIRPDLFEKYQDKYPWQKYYE